MERNKSPESLSKCLRSAVGLASGDHVQCNKANEADLFEAARLGFGSVGLITAVEMELAQARY